MNKKIISIGKYLLLFLLAGALLYFAFKGVSIRRIFSEMLKAKLFWVFLSFTLSLIALVSRAYRWNLLIEPLGYKPKLKNTTFAVSIGYFANLAFPRLGEVSRCGALNRAEDVPFNKLIGTVVVERAVDVLSLLVCLVLAAIIEFKRLGNFLMTNIVDPIFNKLKQYGSSPVVIIILVVVILSIAIFIFYRRKSRKGKPSAIMNFLIGIIDGLKSIGNLKRPWLFVFHSILIWFLYYLGVYVCLFALPSTSGLGMGAALFLLVAGGLGMSAPVQGGIGAYHILVSQGLILYGLSKEEGLTFATLVHSIQLTMVVLTGTASLLLLFISRKRSEKEKQSLSPVETAEVS